LQNWAVIFRASNITTADVAFFAFSFGPFIGFWLAFEAAQRAGIRCIAAGGSIPATRQRITEGWGGARVVDHHGMTEVGPASFECPDRPNVLHIIETAYIPEIIDPATGAHRNVGESGE